MFNKLKDASESVLQCVLILNVFEQRASVFQLLHTLAHKAKNFLTCTPSPTHNTTHHNTIQQESP